MPWNWENEKWKWKDAKESTVFWHMLHIFLVCKTISFQKFMLSWLVWSARVNMMVLRNAELLWANSSNYVYWLKYKMIKKFTQLTRNLIFFCYIFKNTFQHVPFNISIYRVLKWQPPHPFPLHHKFTADWILLLTFLVSQKTLILNRLGQEVMILTGIWQVPGLHFGLDADYPD